MNFLPVEILNIPFHLVRVARVPDKHPMGALAFLLGAIPVSRHGDEKMVVGQRRSTDDIPRIGCPLCVVEYGEVRPTPPETPNRQISDRFLPENRSENRDNLRLGPLELYRHLSEGRREPDHFD